MAQAVGCRSRVAAAVAPAAAQLAARFPKHSVFYA
jgi:hypothetical protein